MKVATSKMGQSAMQNTAPRGASTGQVQGASVGMGSGQGQLLVPANLNEMIATAVSSGLGYAESVPLAHNAWVRSTTPLTGATTPAIAQLETNTLGIQWAAGNSNAITLVWPVPDNYDRQGDKIALGLLSISAGTTNTPTFTATVFRKRGTAALSADLGSTASAAVPTSTAGAAWVYVKIYGKGFIGGDIITIVLTPGSHSTDALNVYGTKLDYQRNISGWTATSGISRRLT